MKKIKKEEQKVRPNWFKSVVIAAILWMQCITSISIISLLSWASAERNTREHRFPLPFTTIAHRSHTSKTHSKIEQFRLTEYQWLFCIHVAFQTFLVPFFLTSFFSVPSFDSLLICYRFIQEFLLSAAATFFLSLSAIFLFRFVSVRLDASYCCRRMSFQHARSNEEKTKFNTHTQKRLLVNLH